jgi:metal-dependent amidase/aminoacylase/carboxypeptidase family protein
MRQQLRPDARINAMITKAGEAANIIPAFTSAHYMVRSDDDAYLSELLKRVQNIATASALACGCQVSWKPLMKGYRPLKYAPALCALFQKHMERISILKNEYSRSIHCRKVFPQLFFF